jgi:hypothetical protein
MVHLEQPIASQATEKASGDFEPALLPGCFICGFSSFTSTSSMRLSCGIPGWPTV